VARKDYEAVDRYLEKHNLGISMRDLMVLGEGQRVSSLCWLEDARRVLVLRRRHEPFAGYFTAPGGKLEPGEDPEQCIIREMQEEAGIQIQSPQLQLVTSERGPENYRWVVFIFRARQYQGQVGTTDEGSFLWVPKEELARSTMLPEVDRLLLPYMLPLHDHGVHLAHVVYRDDHSVADLAVTPLPPLGAGAGPGVWKA